MIRKQMAISVFNSCLEEMVVVCVRKTNR